MKDNWQGYIIDDSKSKISKIKKSYYYWMYQLEANSSFISKNNINEILSKSGFDFDLGIMSIDIDGNDYYIIDEIQNYRPRILICEFNAVFGHKRKISIPYQSNFIRSKIHSSNLYFGASLGSISYLVDKKGYSLIGTNNSGVNAFFVRNDLLNNKIKNSLLKKLTHPLNIEKVKTQKEI